MSPRRLVIISIWAISILLRVLFVGCYSIFKRCGLAEESVAPGVGCESLQPHRANGSFSLLHTCSCWCNLSALPWPQSPCPSAIKHPLSDTVAQIHFFWSYLWSWYFATAAERWVIECERFDLMSPCHLDFWFLPYKSWPRPTLWTFYCFLLQVP